MDCFVVFGHLLGRTGTRADLNHVAELNLNVRIPSKRNLQPPRPVHVHSIAGLVRVIE